MGRWDREAGAYVFGAGFPSGVFRFAGYIVLGIYMSATSAAYKYVKNHPTIVQQPPFHPNTLHLSHLASKWSIIGFWWNFVMWIPNMAAPSVFVTIIGLFDVTITVYFGIVTVRQAAYIPHSSGPCRNAVTWRIPMNGNGSFFHILETLNTYPDTPETHVPSDVICKAFVSQWRIGIGSLVLYILVSLSNVIVSMIMSTHGLRSQMSPERKLKEPYALTMLRVLCLLPHCICDGIAEFFRFLVIFLPRPVQSRLRFGLHYIFKASQVVYFLIQDLPQKISVLLTYFKRLQCPPEAPKQVQFETKDRDAPLVRFLHIDILTIVAQHLHFQDLVNLSLASKEMRRMLFPNGHFGNETAILRIYACDNATKVGCFVCRFPVCGVG
ncbi:hypothetical protein AJ78_02407 [Emergomyces pasteurianus Ep9510]|uniref:F-box domain-containing protein n=1 Tax=Emergomyces pasteurianus Ep9510 TaxID=1447872 RepID=A0A1J9PMY8_9EURO|nr:hypothetical protein AJ78_02407 [Emergomyces pasteurianus Ep9510]